MTRTLFLAALLCCAVLLSLHLPYAVQAGSPRHSDHDEKVPSSHSSHHDTHREPYHDSYHEAPHDDSHSHPHHPSSSSHSSPSSSRLGRVAMSSRVYPSQTLQFSDDFDEFDLSVWEHELTMGGGGNWEFELYTNNRSNSFVRDSVLFLKPTLTADFIGEDNVQSGYTMDMWGSSPADACTGNAFYGCERTSGAGGNIINPISSARIRTTNFPNVKYGRVEVNAKLPIGDWLWPAIWMVPRYNSYGMWPASGEIDIMESHGNNASYSAGGYNSVGSTLHWGPTYGQDPWPLTHANRTLPPGQSFADSFHTFGVAWTNTSLYTYIDDDANHLLHVDYSRQSFWDRGGWGTDFANPWEGRGNAAPFDQAFYLVLNVAVGGVSDYFPDHVGGKPWANADGDAANRFYAAKKQWLPTWKYGSNQAALQVDWVKVWSW